MGRSADGHGDGRGAAEGAHHGCVGGFRRVDVRIAMGGVHVIDIYTGGWSMDLSGWCLSLHGIGGGWVGSGGSTLAYLYIYTIYMCRLHAVPPPPPTPTDPPPPFNPNRRPQAPPPPWRSPCSPPCPWRSRASTRCTATPWGASSSSSPWRGRSVAAVPVYTIYLN